MGLAERFSVRVLSTSHCVMCHSVVGLFRHFMSHFSKRPRAHVLSTSHSVVGLFHITRETYTTGPKNPPHIGTKYFLVRVSVSCDMKETHKRMAHTTVWRKKKTKKKLTRVHHKRDPRNYSKTPPINPPKTPQMLVSFAGLFSRSFSCRSPSWRVSLVWVSFFIYTNSFLFYVSLVWVSFVGRVYGSLLERPMCICTTMSADTYWVRAETAKAFVCMHTYIDMYACIHVRTR